MKIRTPILLVLLLVTLGAALSIPSRAQESPGEDQGSEAPDLFFEKVEVNVVNVEVFVTDKDGAPITGLTRDNFEILEDGRPVEITNFRAFEKRRRHQLAARDLRQLPTDSGLEEEIEPLADQDDQPLFLVVFIDNFNIRPANRNWVIDSLRSFLYQHMDRYDWVMLVTYDRDLHVRQPFTDNPDEVMVALDEVEKLVGSAVALDSERRRVLEDIDRSPDVGFANNSVRAYADYVYNGMSFTLDSLREMISSLAGLPGRKALLHVSDGIPMRPAEDMFVAMEERWPDTVNRSSASTWDLSNRYRSVINYANSSGVTFYTLDAKGLQDDAQLTADEVPRQRIRDMRAVQITRGFNLREPLRMMAIETGGRAILGTNALLPALDRVAQDFETFYSLGYQPAHVGDGRYHKIEVRVDRKGARVRHRDGYRDKTAEARMTEASSAVLHYGFERNPMDAWIEFGRPEKQDGGNYAVPIDVKVPIRSISMAPTEEIFYGRLNVSVAVMDDKGDVSPLQQQPAFHLRIPVDEYEGAQEQHVTYGLSLLMRRGPHRVVIGLQDELGSEISFVTGRLMVGG
jgi:VWFA-related protein